MECGQHERAEPIFREAFDILHSCFSMNGYELALIQGLKDTTTRQPKGSTKKETWNRLLHLINEQQIAALKQKTFLVFIRLTLPT